MTARALLASVLVALSGGAALAQVPGENDEVGGPAQGRPDLRPERVALEAVGGTYAGLAGYFIGRSLGTVATRMISTEQEPMRDRIVHTTGVVGGAFAIGGAVYAIGDMGSETGSFPTTMAGVGVGLGVGYLLSRVVFRGRIPADRGSAKRKWLMATLECSLPAIGATIAFNS